MRIISGKYRGRHFNPPKNITARPTTDFAKESLFNLLQNRLDFEGLDVLDLFAGTGSIGLEFASRGARTVTSVELAHTQQNFIIATCKSLGVNNLTVIRGDVFKYVTSCHREFDVVFADPPYSLDTLAIIPDLVFGNKILRNGGLFVLEHSAAYDFSANEHFSEHRSYGNVHFTFFE